MKYLKSFFLQVLSKFTAKFLAQAVLFFCFTYLTECPRKARMILVHKVNYNSVYFRNDIVHVNGLALSYIFYSTKFSDELRYD